MKTKIAFRFFPPVVLFCFVAALASSENISLIDSVVIPAGTFTLGRHTVSVSAFRMAKTEITQAQYRALTGMNPSYFQQGDEAANRPVEQTSWFDAVTFCNLLSVREGFDPVYTIIKNGRNIRVLADFNRNGWRLPTAAEWEWAALGGSAARNRFSGGNTIETVAWYEKNSDGTTHPVARKAANSYGLFDLTGNVWEWCWDWYGDAYPSSPFDPRGPVSGNSRVLRGGSWYHEGDRAEISLRYSRNPGAKNSDLGFRVVRRETGR